MSLGSIKNGNEIEVADEGTTIIAYNDNDEKVIVPYNVLKWRNPYEDGDDHDLPLFLTLDEIKEQLFSMNYKPVFYVWYDLGLSGKIYQYGNYPDTLCWIEYGITRGYA